VCIFKKKQAALKQRLLQIQVASYGVGGHFYLHHDPMFIYKEPGFHATSVETRGTDSYITGTFPSPLHLKNRTFNFPLKLRYFKKTINLP
jgi:hypothetical protein